MDEKSKKIPFASFEYVLGAFVAEGYLKAKGINVDMDEFPEDGDAKLWIEEDKKKEALQALEEWRNEVKNTFLH